MSVSKSDQTTVPTPEERLQSSRPMEDGLLKQTVMDLDWKVVQKVGLESNNTSEVLDDFNGENEVEQTGDHSPVELVLEKESSKDNTQDADHSLVKLEIKKQSNKNNTHDSGSKTEKGNSRRKKSKQNRGSNTQNTLATVRLDGQPCARVVTDLHEASNSWDDLTALHEANTSLDDLMQPSFASDMSHREVEPSVSTSSKKTTVQPTSERLQSSKRGGLESSNTNEALPDEKYDEEIKEGKGKNKGGRIKKKEKVKSNVNTYTRDEHSNVHSPVDLGLEKQTRIDKTKDVEIKKGKGKNKGKCVKKNKGSNSLNTCTGDEHSNVLSQLELVLQKQTSNENTQDAEIKKGKGKSKKKKGSNILVDGQHCAGEGTTLQEANTTCNDLNQPFSTSDTSRPEVDLVVSKSDEKTMQTFVERPVVDGFLNYVGSESINITEALQEENHVEEADDDYNNGDHSMSELLEKQSSNDNTQDVENTIRKGKYVAGEVTMMCEENSTCNDMKPPSAFDTGIKTLDPLKYGSSMLGMAAAFLGIRMWKKWGF